MKRQTFLVRAAFILTTIVAYGYAQQQIPFPVNPDDPDPTEVCVNCRYDGGQLVRDKTIDEQSCREIWGNEAPRRWYVGRCRRVECDTGFYYMWEDWIPLDTVHCTNVEKNDPSICPSPRCIYVPWISDPKTVSTVFQSCEAAKGKPITNIQASWLNQQAMQTNEKR